MHVTRSRRHTAVATVLAVALIAGFAGVAATACQARPTATGEAAGQRAALAEIESFAEALNRGQEVNYSAEYATAEGTAVTVAQAPPRRAYRNIDNTYVIDADSAYLCRAVECKHVPGADSIPLPHARAVTVAFGDGFVVAEHAVVLLARAASLAGSRAGRAERVVAGARADCLAITTADTVLTGCLSAAGILAYFDGTTEAGLPVRVELRRYSPTVVPDAFDLPANAKILDVDRLQP